MLRLKPEENADPDKNIHTKWISHIERAVRLGAIAIRQVFDENALLRKVIDEHALAVSELLARKKQHKDRTLEALAEFRKLADKLKAE